MTPSNPIQLDHEDTERQMHERATDSGIEQHVDALLVLLNSQATVAKLARERGWTALTGVVDVGRPILDALAARAKASGWYVSRIEGRALFVAIDGEHVCINEAAS